jgi:hypothetical protein
VLLQAEIVEPGLELPGERLDRQEDGPQALSSSVVAQEPESSRRNTSGDHDCESKQQDGAESQGRQQSAQ